MSILLPLRLVLLLLPCLSSAAESQSRLLRQYAHERGVIPPIWTIGQDQQGFLWVGAQGGLFRYDGIALESVQLGHDPGAVISLAFDHRGGIAVVTERGALFELAGSAVRELRPPGGPGPRKLHMIAYGGDGALWTIRDSTLYQHTLDGGWRALEAAKLHAERPLMVRSDVSGGVLVGTDRGVWRLSGGRQEKLLEAEYVADMVPSGADVLVLDGYGRVLQSGVDAAGIPLPLPETTPQVVGSRPISVARRGATTWVSFDRFLLALRPDQPVEVLGSADGIHTGGPLFVDREGSLWMGTYSALIQLPEPDTRVWVEQHGIPSRHARFVGRTEGTLWVTTWQGAASIRSATVDVASRPAWFSQERLCTHPARGTLWTSSRSGRLELYGDTVLRRAIALGVVLGCAPARDGGLWLATSSGLEYVTPSGEGPMRIATPDPPTDVAWETVLEDSRGNLLVAASGRVCTRSTTDGSWSCEAIGGTGKVTSIVDVGDGHLWMSTMHAGILSRSPAGGWVPLPAARALPTSSVFSLEDSPSGGIWIVGHGVIQRVTPAADDWEVLEQLGPWNGLPMQGGADITEDADGTLWIASSAGLTQVPPSARFARADPPPVALVEALHDGRALDATRTLELPHRRNRLELRFAALSYRDPGMLHYQIRNGPADPWRSARGNSSFHWSDLSPGRYDVQFRASLDGRRWSTLPASVGFTIRPPWYREPWATLLFLLIGAGVAAAVHQGRVRMLLGLERQRTRIAMDLHDAIGSGLGSIGIMAGALAASPDRPSAAPRGGGRDLAQEIASTAEQLGASLSDIVWALDPHTASLQEMAARLAEHGDLLCGARENSDFVTEFPAVWPDVSLPLRVRRNVVAIGLEALHNAARHACASRVVLGLRSLGSEWELRIEDDGRGFSTPAVPTTPAQHGGRGLPAMQRRAREIGASLAVTATPGHGTTVRLRFSLR